MIPRWVCHALFSGQVPNIKDTKAGFILMPLPVSNHAAYFSFSIHMHKGCNAVSRQARKIQDSAIAACIADSGQAVTNAIDGTGCHRSLYISIKASKTRLNLLLWLSHCCYTVVVQLHS